MNQQKKINVQIRMYKGDKLAYDENQKVLNENQPVDLEYPTFEFENFFKYIGSSGFSKITVEKCTDSDGNKIDIPEEVTAFIKNALSPEKKVELTPEQKEIAALRQELADFKKDNQAPAGSNLLESLRAEYKAVTGKTANHLVKEAKLTQMIQEFKEQNQK